MDEPVILDCPHCGESFPLAYDISEGSTTFVTDCYVCCRPMQVRVRVAADGSVAAVEIEPE